MTNKINLVSWNVNGIRSVDRNGGLKRVMTLDPDILCLQEIRIDKDPKIDLGSYHAEYNFAARKGYAGTAILSKQKPIRVIMDGDMDIPYSKDGRMIIAEFEDLFVMTVYGPVATNGEILVSKCEWLAGLIEMAEVMNESKPAIICGDFNIAPTSLDVCHGRIADGSTCCTDYERTCLGIFEEKGFIDIYRKQNPRGDDYTWWSHKGRCRALDLGYRLDLFFVSQNIVNRCECNLLNNIFGSDHCPVQLSVKGGKRCLDMQL